MPTGIYQRKYKPSEERFINLIRKTDTCWLWGGTIAKTGYGKFYLFTEDGKKEVRAHRFSYELFNGKIENELCVCHSCDVKSCVNPKHLWIGTHSDNMKDRDNKNRQASGERNGNSKLKQKEINEIRKKYKTGRYSQRELGKVFSVSQAMIGDIISNKNWKL